MLILAKEIAMRGLGMNFAKVFMVMALAGSLAGCVVYPGGGYYGGGGYGYAPAPVYGGIFLGGGGGWHRGWR